MCHLLTGDTLARVQLRMKLVDVMHVAVDANFRITVKATNPLVVVARNLLPKLVEPSGVMLGWKVGV